MIWPLEQSPGVRHILNEVDWADEVEYTAELSAPPMARWQFQGVPSIPQPAGITYKRRVVTDLEKIQRFYNKCVGINYR